MSRIHSKKAPTSLKDSREISSLKFMIHMPYMELIFKNTKLLLIPTCDDFLALAINKEP